MGNWTNKGGLKYLQFGYHIDQQKDESKQFMLADHAELINNTTQPYNFSHCECMCRLKSDQVRLREMVIGGRKEGAKELFLFFLLLFTLH